MAKRYNSQAFLNENFTFHPDININSENVSYYNYANHNESLANNVNSFIYYTTKMAKNDSRARKERRVLSSYVNNQEGPKEIINDSKRKSFSKIFLLLNDNKNRLLKKGELSTASNVCNIIRSPK